jgi:hypothetical protein
MLASPLVFLFNRHLQPLFKQMEQVPIADATSQRLYEVAVRDAVEGYPVLIPLSTTRKAPAMTAQRSK